MSLADQCRWVAPTGQSRRLAGLLSSRAVMISNMRVIFTLFLIPFAHCLHFLTLSYVAVVLQEHVCVH